MDLFTLKHQMKINNEDGENEREREKHYAIKCSSQKVLLQQLNISFFHFFQTREPQTTVAL